MAMHQIEDNIENHMSLIYIYIFISSLQAIQHCEITCNADKKLNNIICFLSKLCLSLT